MTHIPTPPDHDSVPARTESGLQPDRTSYERVEKELREDRDDGTFENLPGFGTGHSIEAQNGRLGTTTHTQPRGSPAGTALRGTRREKGESKKSRSRAPSKAPTAHSHHSSHRQVLETYPAIPMEDDHGQGRDGSVTERPISIAPTTASNVKKMVADSKFHDEALCQLLDAARLNLIGSEAKKALQRAARARVIELRELREGGEVSVSSPETGLEPDAMVD